MANQRKLLIKNKSDCLKFFDSLSKINESVILQTDSASNTITALTSSIDNTLILYTEYCGVEASFTGTLNIPDVKKLTRVIETINDEEIELIVNSNNIEYKGKILKFKYHLYDDGFLSKPTLNINKIKEFTYDVGFDLKKEIMTSLIRGSSFSSETNKLYLYTEDGSLKGELTDRARHNTDTFCLDLGEVDFDLNPLPINLDNIKLISMISDTIRLNINKAYGVSIIDIFNNDIKLKYIITSLTQ